MSELFSLRRLCFHSGYASCLSKLLYDGKANYSTMFWPISSSGKTWRFTITAAVRKICSQGTTVLISMHHYHALTGIEGEDRTVMIPRKALEPESNYKHYLVSYSVRMLLPARRTPNYSPYLYAVVTWRTGNTTSIAQPAKWNLGR